VDGKVLGVNVRAGHHKGQPENKGIITQSSFISASYLLKKARAYWAVLLPLLTAASRLRLAL
jgi:hypothetical protein